MIATRGDSRRFSRPFRARVGGPDQPSADAQTPTRHPGKNAASTSSAASRSIGEADTGPVDRIQRAYALAPNAAVLYKVGETEYQLQDYAGPGRSLSATVRILPRQSHRADVEASVQVLRARVAA